MAKNKILDKVSEILLVFLVFGLPLFFAPILTDSFEFGKQIFLLVSSFLVFVVWAVKSLITKKLTFQKTPYLVSTFLFLLSFLASTLINSPNKTNSFAAPVGTGALLLVTLVYILISNLGKSKLLLLSILAGAGLTSFVSLILLFGNFSFPLNFPSLNLVIPQTWSPTGSLISQVVFLLVAVVIGFGLIYEEIKKKNFPFTAILFTVNILLLSGLAASLHLLTSAKIVLLPQSTAWAIAVESLKSGRIAFFGLGPGEFIHAFTSFKPLYFNNSEYWNIRFASSSNWYFQVLTEIGRSKLL